MQTPRRAGYKGNGPRPAPSNLPKLVASVYTHNETEKVGDFTVTVERGPSAVSALSETPQLVWVVLVEGLRPLPVLHRQETTFRIGARNITRFETTTKPNLETLRTELGVTVHE